MESGNSPFQFFLGEFYLKSYKKESKEASFKGNVYSVLVNYGAIDKFDI